MEQEKDQELEDAERLILQLFLRTRGEGPEWQRIIWTVKAMQKGGAARMLGEAVPQPVSYMNLLSQVKDHAPPT